LVAPSLNLLEDNERKHPPSRTLNITPISTVRNINILQIWNAHINKKVPPYANRAWTIQKYMTVIFPFIPT